jgi:DUF1365 family protein
VVIEAGLYVGRLRHRRFAPVTHAFEYPLCMALLDIDRLRESMAVSWLTSYNRWNWLAFDERDHIGDPSKPLRERVQASARANGVALPDGPIYLLTHLRYGGYVFNPISLYYCYDHAGTLCHVLADVRNTYRGRHQYWLQPADSSSHRFRATAAKALYVSPFMAQDVDYEFVLTPPDQTLVAHINVTRGARLFDATLTLDRHPWSAADVRGALLRFPLMTVNVMAAIHWEAIRLRLKGLRMRPLPPPSPARAAPMPQERG